jgi:WD40 repeat protein
VLCVLAVPLSACGSAVPAATPTKVRPIPTAAATPVPLAPLQPITVESAGSVRLLRTMAIPHYNGRQVSQCSVAFSPDRTLLVGACCIYRLPVWDVGDGQRLATLPCRRDAVLRVAFRLDGTLLASISSDGTVRLWGVSLD